MALALACNRCGRTLQSTGTRGLCPACLFLFTVPRREPEDPRDQTTRFAPEPEHWEPGVTVGAGNRFKLLEKLGQGGMGEVWLASDEELSEPDHPQLVALKFLSEEIRHDARALASLRAEVLRSQRLTHPNIVRIFDLHTHHGTPFIKMEFVDGNSLSRWLDAQPDRVMDWRMAAQLMRQLGDALQYAHQREGIIHRDIKPANLLLETFSRNGPQIKLSDFGIAMAAHHQAGPHSGLIGLGTLAYASPQQLAGDPPCPEDDVYSVGVTLYEALTGTVPFEADSLEDFMGKLHFQPAQPIPERLKLLGKTNTVPGRMLVLIQRCLDKNPALRPKTREIVNTVLPVLGSAAPVAQPAELLEAEWDVEPEKRRLNLSFWFLLLLAAAMGWFIYSRDWSGLKRFWSRNVSQPSVVTNSPANPAPQVETNPVPGPMLPGTAGASNSFLSANAGAWNGAVKVHLARDKERGPVHCQLYRQDAPSELINAFYLEGTTYPQRVVPLPEGNYTLKAIDRGSWTLEETFEVRPGETNAVNLAFSYGYLTINSWPLDARLSWAQTGMSSATNAAPPRTERFRSGRIWVRAECPQYVTVETNFPFRPGAEAARLDLVLNRSLTPKSGEVWTNSLGMVFRWVQARGFWASATETRVSEFRKFVEAARPTADYGMLSLTATGMARCGFAWSRPNPAWGQTEDHPVVGVNWMDATGFCVWLTETERAAGRLRRDQEYRLPSTNEWFALAAGQHFPGGETNRNPIGNYSRAEAVTPDWPAAWPVLAGPADPFPRTAPVDAPQVPANSLGLRHLGGNAAEWCQDKVLCGGSWCDGELSDTEFLAATNVRTANPDARCDSFGFRAILIETRQP